MTLVAPPMPTHDPDSADPSPEDTGSGSQGLLDRWSDPVSMLVAAGVLVLVALLPWAVRSLVVLPLALVLPGHALLAALDRPDRGLGTGGRLALRVILSLSAISLSVLAVGSVVGVSKASVLAGTWMFVSIAALASWTRDVPTKAESAGPRWTQSGVVLVLTALVGLVVVVGALVLLPEPLDSPYSRISVTGTSKASGSPIRVRSGTTASVQVQVENQTAKTHAYRVIPAIDGGALWKAPKVRLAPGERWSGTIEGKVPKDACLSRLTVSLAADGKAAGVAPLVLYVRNEAGDACG